MILIEADIEQQVQQLIDGLANKYKIDHITATLAVILSVFPKNSLYYMGYILADADIYTEIMAHMESLSIIDMLINPVIILGLTIILLNYKSTAYNSSSKFMQSMIINPLNWLQYIEKHIKLDVNVNKHSHQSFLQGFNKIYADTRPKIFKIIHPQSPNMQDQNQ